MKHHFEPFNSKYMAGCQQPFWSKMAGDNRLSAASFGPKRLVTTGCQQPSPKLYITNIYCRISMSIKVPMSHVDLSE